MNYEPTSQSMWTAAEAGKYIGFSEQRLAKERLSGSGPIFYKLGRSVRYRKEDLDAWLESKARVSTSDIPAHEAAAA